jgi:transcriptional regulator with XRE-family HTH domain
VRPEAPEDFARRVTKRIAEIRRERNITQDRIAEALGTATRNYQRLEAGQNLTLETLARVAVALGVEPEELVARTPVARRRYAPLGPVPIQAVADRRGGEKKGGKGKNGKT